jgi:hypothetical protein
MISYYNEMKFLENTLEEKKKEILNTAYKKAKLVQKLTSIFSKLTKHEESVIEKVSNSFTNLIAIANAYPNLMTNSTFFENYSQIEKLENELQTKMADYNSYITKFNNKVTQFPGFILASIFGFKKRIYAEFK